MAEKYSKSELIEKLREYVGVLPSELSDIAYEAVDALESEPRWVPCSERLPEEKEDVLVISWNGKSRYVGQVDAFGKWHTEDGEVIDGYEPLAWMPLGWLPEPYRTGE